MYPLTFGKKIFSTVIKVPLKLHRFARFYYKVNFRFGAVPLQLIVEQLDLNSDDSKAVAGAGGKPSASSSIPDCVNRPCFGGVSVNNGQVLDHSLPTGFSYKVWILMLSTKENIR